MVTKNSWYFRMQQEEIELFSDGEHFERLIYESIKSFSANGKNTVTLSLRNIASRATTSKSTVKRILPKLLRKNIVQIVGYEKRIGGHIPVYKVCCSGTVTVSAGDSLLSKTVPYSPESVPNMQESVPTIGIKIPQPNKLNKTYKLLSEEDLYNTSLSLQVSLSLVKQKYGELRDLVASGEFQKKYATYTDLITPLRRWIQHDIDQGFIERMNEVEKIANELDEPTKKLDRQKLVHEYEKLEATS